MLTDSYIKSLKIGDKKRHTALYGLVLELRPTKKKWNNSPYARNVLTGNIF